MGWSQRRVSWEKTCAGLGAVKVMTASAGKYGVGDGGAGFIGGPAGGEIDGENGGGGGLDPAERGEGKAAHGGRKAGAEDRVDDEVRVQRGLVLGQRGFVFDDGDSAVGRRDEACARPRRRRP